MNAHANVVGAVEAEEAYWLRNAMMLSAAYLPVLTTLHFCGHLPASIDPLALFELERIENLVWFGRLSLPDGQEFDLRDPPRHSHLDCIEFDRVAHPLQERIVQLTGYALGKPLAPIPITAQSSGSFQAAIAAQEPGAVVAWANVRAAQLAEMGIVALASHRASVARAYAYTLFRLPMVHAAFGRFLKA